MSLKVWFDTNDVSIWCHLRL